MKAVAVFPKTHEVKLIDHPEPRITTPSEVKIKMLGFGVCGADRGIWEFKYGEPSPGSDYLITGHESLGQVVELGSVVKTVKVGDHVVLTVRRGCPENCLSCANGQPDFCFTGHFTERGIKQRHGYMTEFVVDEEKYFNVVPAELHEVAVLLEPLTLGVNGTFIFTGVPAPQKDLTLDTGMLMRRIVLKIQVILRTVNAPKIAFENGLRHLSASRGAWPRSLEELITVRLPPDPFEQTVQRGASDGINSVLAIA